MGQVGVIGLGAMGRSIARHLVARGHQVAACDVEPASVEALSRLGARAVRSPCEVGALSEMILVVVVDDDQVAEVCLGSDGVLAGARRDAVIVILSSVGPETCRTIASRAEASGAFVLDAPMIGGSVAAEEGALLLMVGGDPATLERCRPILQAFARDIWHLGPVGTGQIAKSINNLLLWASVTAIYESIALARPLGLDPAALRAILGHASGDSWALKEWESLCEIPKWWHQKDLDGVLRLAEKTGRPAPLAAALKDLLVDLTPGRAREVFAPSPLADPGHGSRPLKSPARRIRFTATERS